MMRLPLRFTSVALLGLALAGCGSTPVPDVAYYQLPPSVSGEVHAEPPIAVPIVVDVMIADGLHGEQAILYSTQPGASIKAYHYQLWNDPPVRLLQRRLIRRLRDENAAVMVTDRLSTSLSSLRVSGVLERFERTFEGDTWNASVQLELRVDSLDTELPLLLKTYEATVPADGETIQGTVRAFAKATDQVFGEFTNDLLALKP